PFPPRRGKENPASTKVSKYLLLTEPDRPRRRRILAGQVKENDDEDPPDRGNPGPGGRRGRRGAGRTQVPERRPPSRVPLRRPPPDRILVALPPAPDAHRAGLGAREVRVALRRIRPLRQADLQIGLRLRRILDDASDLRLGRSPSPKRPAH